MRIYDRIINSSRKCSAVLIDPDKNSAESVKNMIDVSLDAGVDFFFVGGSLMTNDQLGETIRLLKSQDEIPVVIFPGSTLQINKDADAILLLSLISGRNPDLLIGHHVIAAPYLRDSGLEVLPTGYMLIDSGRMTTALYMSNTTPIPQDKEDIAACTALAGQMLGMKMIYMDGGSGALNPIPGKMIRSVKNALNVPLVVGGGIRSAAAASEACKAGADLVVIGNALEENPSLIKEISHVIHQAD